VSAFVLAAQAASASVLPAESTTSHVPHAAMVLCGAAGLATRERTSTFPYNDVSSQVVV
jgi:hypothetical protein